MTRIMPNEVVAAYRTLGAKVIRGSFGNAGACCAMGAIAYEDGASDAIDWLDHKGFPMAYRESFGRGFDGLVMLRNGSVEAYQDGQAVWAAIVEAGL